MLVHFFAPVHSHSFTFAFAFFTLRSSLFFHSLSVQSFIARKFPNKIYKRWQQFFLSFLFWVVLVVGRCVFLYSFLSDSVLFILKLHLLILQEEEKNYVFETKTILQSEKCGKKRHTHIHTVI